jgi:hypothetical protein
LIEWIGVKWEVEKLFRIIASIDAVMNKLVKECRFPDAATADESKQRLILELAIRCIGAGEMIEIASLTSGQVEGICPVLPPRVMIVERLSQDITGIERHSIVISSTNAVAMIVSTVLSTVGSIFSLWTN